MGPLSLLGGLASGASSAASSASSQALQSGSDAIQGQSVQDTLTKMERDRQNAQIAGVQGSATTFISAIQQNKISF